MIRHIQSIAADDRGTSLVEMGLIAPFLASFIIGMVDLSNGYSARLQLEQAAQVAIEKVQGYQTTTSTYDTLKAEAANAAGVDQSAVVVRYWLECDGVKQTDYNTTCSGTAVYARWIQVEVTKTYTPYFKITWPHANADGSFTLVGKAGMRTQ